MNLRPIWILIAGLGFAVSEALAQDPRLEARLEPAARAGVAPVLERARAEGIPAEPLIQRALEGASRGAPPDRITDAVAELAARLRTARSALGARTDETELVAAAGALYAGVTEAELRQLRAVERNSLAVPLVTLADLLERGVPSSTALSIILSLLDARVPIDGFGRFREVVAQDIARGAPPAAAAQTRAQGLLVERQRPPRRGPGADRPRGPIGPRGPGGPGGRPLR